MTQNDFEQNVPVIQSDNLFYPLSKTVGTTTLAKYKTSPFLNKSLDFLLFFCFKVDIYNIFSFWEYCNPAVVSNRSSGSNHNHRRLLYHLLTDGSNGSDFNEILANFAIPKNTIPHPTYKTISTKPFSTSTIFYPMDQLNLTIMRYFVRTFSYANESHCLALVKLYVYLKLPISKTIWNRLVAFNIN